MPKRLASQLDEGEVTSSKKKTSGKRPSQAPEDEMGDFEDEWEDEVDSNENAIDASKNDATENEDEMEIDVQGAVEDDDPPPPETKVFLPGRHTLAKDEILEPDQSAYEVLHRMNTAWPCLSFDILRDGLGDERRKYPTTAYAVTGTQADQANKNELLVLKMSALHRTQKDDGDSDSEEEDDDEDLDENAVLESRSLPHVGGVNRVRAQPLPTLSTSSLPYHVATWAETGKVHIFNIRQFLESLDTSGYAFDREKASKPVYTVTAHGRSEGFAMDWAASTNGLRLLTGDITSKIYLTTSTASGFTTMPNPFMSHTSSVEDIQWSPSEPTVFASCSADQSIRIWDVRVKGRRSVVAVERAHDADVNVISWNRNPTTAYLLVSGGDDGNLKVWDMRSWKPDAAKPSPVAMFNWHKAPITSVEWHPTEDSAFVASGADHQVTIWDLAVEEDAEDVTAGNADAKAELKDVPPQLLFVHQGQKDIKEVHWHPQISGMVISTAFDGFNVFKTISI